MPLEQVKNSGIGLLAAATLMFSLGGLCIKACSMTPLAINSGRNLLAAAISWWWMRRCRRRFVLRWPVVAGALALSVTTNLYALACKLTCAANAIVLQYTSVAFIILLGRVLLGTPLGRRELATLALVLGGIVACFWGGFTTASPLGDLLALGSGLSYAGVFLQSAAPGADSASAFLLGQLISGVVGLPFLVAGPPAGGTDLVCIGVLGVFQLGVSYILLEKGLAAAGPVRAGFITAAEPVLNPVWVALFYGERLRPASALGCLLVLAGILYYQRAGPQIQKK